MKAEKVKIQKTKKMSRPGVEKLLNKLNIEYWFPDDVTYPYELKTALVQLSK